MNAALYCKRLDIVIGGLTLVRELELRLHRGELLCVIGCNGAGKTSLLHTLAGLRDGRDRIELDGQVLATMTRRRIATALALLLQGHDDAFPTTVQETVMAARHPHQPLLSGDDSDDLRIAGAALERLKLTELAGRDVASLSGGERQRVAIAAVLAQRPQVYLLDEPLNNLDPRHQIDVMRDLRAERDNGASVVAVMHDLNLVARFADRVLLLFGPSRDGEWFCDSVGEAMSTTRLSQLYETKIGAIEHGGRRYYYSD